MRGRGWLFGNTKRGYHPQTTLSIAASRSRAAESELFKLARSLPVVQRLMTAERSITTGKLLRPAHLYVRHLYHLAASRS